jgi:hypothetical protein
MLVSDLNDHVAKKLKTEGPKQDLKLEVIEENVTENLE